MPNGASSDSGPAAPHPQAAANLSALIESTEDLIWSIDLDYRLLTFNSALRRHIERHFGTIAQIGKRPEDLLPPERASIWPPLFQRALNEGPFREAIPFPNDRVVEMSFNPIVVDGKAAGLSMFGKDITERHRAEKQLRESEELLRVAQRVGSLGSYTLDIPAGRWTGSEVLHELFGIDEHYNHTVEGWIALIHPEDRAAMADYFRVEVLEKKREFDREYRIVRLNDREERWFQGIGKLEFDSTGQPIRMHGVIKDITASKRAQLALAASERLFRAVTDESPLAIHISSGKVEWGEYMNPAFTRILGYTREDIPSVAAWWALAYPDEEYRAKVQAEWDRRVANAIEANTAIEPIETLVTCKDGSTKNITWGFVGVGERDFSYGLDLTKRKQAESELRVSEERYRATFEQAAVGIVHTALDGSFIRCNQRFADIVGYTLEEIRSLTFQRITPPEDIDESLEFLNLLVRGGSGTVSFQKRYLRKDGSLTWTKLTISPQHDAEGRTIHFIAIVEDINSQKAAERRLASARDALRKSEERYRATFEQAAVGIAHIAFDGNFLHCNARFAEIVGYSPDEVLALNAFAITDPAYLSATTPLFEKCASGAAERASFEKRYIRKNASLTWVKVTLSAQRDFEGKPLHLIAFVEDINFRKATEQRLASAQEALRQSEARYRTAFQTTIDAININRLSDGAYLDCNNAFLDIIGYARDEIIGQTSVELGIWARAADREQMVECVLRDFNCRDMEAQFRKKNGEVFWGLMSASLIEIEDVPCVLTITRDISAAKTAERHLTAAAEALRVSEERYRTVFQTSLDSILINRTSDRRFIDVNQAFLDAMGFERDEVIGKTSLDLQLWADPRDLENVDDILRKTRECRNVEIQFRKKNGETLWGLMSASVIEIDEVECVLTITRDISSAKAAEDEIRNLAFYDPLTGLPNRRLLLERLRQSLASGNRSRRMRAVLFVDLDNFKTLNDTLGHQIGDMLLQEAARRLTSCVRETDTVGRLGGDEFVLMLEDLSESPDDAAAQTRAVGEKILSTVADPYLLDGRECRSGASIGISVFGDRRESSSEVLQQADIAMYQAKAAGRNTMRFFEPALQAAVNARAALEEELRQAIKTGQFVLYFQPQIEHHRLIGAEALIRWNHPRRNILSPGEFIPLAEETGLIFPLGKWVLESACRQIAAWARNKQTADLSIAINVSARQFRQPDFVEQLLATLASTGASPANLGLELTESMLVDNIEEVIDKMTELKGHGLKFSLDDFGTGYSSLAYLKRLPLDRLKIDRTFIRDILIDESSAAIAKTILSLSRAMGLPAIAEGVENEQQREFLIRHGCHAFQGRLFGSPAPLEEFEKQWITAPESTAPVAS
jgi:diguanylate cyclase (GGDEF)-like protein/PAS domain S-box-containing protein